MVWSSGSEGADWSQRTVRWKVCVSARRGSQSRPQTGVNWLTASYTGLFALDITWILMGVHTFVRCLNDSKTRSQRSKVRYTETGFSLFVCLRVWRPDNSLKRHKQANLSRKSKKMKNSPTKEKLNESVNS